MGREIQYRIHPAWKIFAACSLIYGCVAGLMVNCRGVYFAEASRDLQVTAGTYGSYLIYYGIAAALSFPVMIKILSRGNIKVVLTSFLLMFSVATVLLGQVRNMTQCYMVACIQGAAGGVLSLYVMPYMVKNWFFKLQGTVLGFSAMFAGIVAAGMNPVTQRLIEEIGWRQTYALAGSMIGLLSIPAVLLLVHRQPSDIGLQPYGFSGEEVSEKAASIAPVAALGKKKYLGICVFLIAAIWSSTVGYAQQLASYAASIPVSAAAGALAVSCSMLGNVGGKLVFGVLNDKFGILKTSICAVSFLLLSFVMLAAGSIQMEILYLGAFLNGISMPLISVQIPLFVGAVYQNKSEYAKKYTNICALNCFISTASAGVMGRLYDAFGSYHYVFAITSVMLCLSIGLVFQCKKQCSLSFNKI